MGTTNM